ncbi:unnamed protein product, partial [Mesorhabditis belari]|uniref:Superoxide dismutase [Cu-Zn] n=1 Tax=Mesorhabditis belari TaxID=2138241 RepID=A0AAF3J1F1_9BILA
MFARGMGFIGNRLPFFCSAYFLTSSLTVTFPPLSYSIGISAHRKNSLRQPLLKFAPVMLKTAALTFVVLFALGDATNQVTRARVYLYKAVKGGIPQTNVGVIDFIQTGNSLSLNGTISSSLGLAPGLHGFHIHEKGDLGNGCMDTGAHYNPHMMTHGAPTDSNRHVGDLGNINAPANGDLQVRVSDTLASLNGPFSIIGRGVVVHEKPDDLGRGGADLSKTTGDAGARLACGVIGIEA